MNVYVDNAATTKLSEKAFEAMVPYLKDHFANPSGTYSEGVFCRRGVNNARHIIAESLRAFDKEIIFTAGGSEADNLAIKGVMEANQDRGRHMITTNIEHHALLESCKWLEKNGYRVTYVPVKPNGIVDPLDIFNAIREDTVLISVMYANNELGTLQPIEEIGKIAKENNILFHTDAVQAYGKFPINPAVLHIDLLSASAHKINGPKGAGFLYVKSGTRIAPHINGGSQERGLRGGTENVAAIAGFEAAVKEAFSNAKERELKEIILRDNLCDMITDSIEGVTVNGDNKAVLPNILNLSFDGIEGDSLLIMLDMKGISASSGSACAQSLEEPSHVLLAIGKSYEEARSSIRFSISYENTMEEMEYLVEKLKESVEYLRRIRA